MSSVKELNSLNAEQKAYVYHVLHRVKSNPDDQVCEFLSGGAGVGKTKTLLVLVQLLSKHFADQIVDYDPEQPTVMVIAPSGAAAYQVRGSTIHSSLNIPYKHSIDNLPSLSMEAKSALQKKFKFGQI